MAVFKTLKLFDYPIFTSDIGLLDTDSKCLVNTINQYSYVMAEKDRDFKKALEDSDVLLPDGIGIVMAAKLLENKKIKKIAGADVHLHLLQRLNEKEGRCMYLGSSDKNLLRIKKRLTREFPGLKANFYSPPYKAQFSAEDTSRMIEAVNLFKPEVLFVGMTAPKQEKWAYEHKDKLDTNIICSIGAVFDFYAGTFARPGKLWIALGLEWFVRLVKEPKRMGMRYLYYGPYFLCLIFKEGIFRLFRKA